MASSSSYSSIIPPLVTPNPEPLVHNDDFDMSIIEKIDAACARHNKSKRDLIGVSPRPHKRRKTLPTLPISKKISQVMVDYLIIDEIIALHQAFEKDYIFKNININSTESIQHRIQSNPPNIPYANQTSASAVSKPSLLQSVENGITDERKLFQLMKTQGRIRKLVVRGDASMLELLVDVFVDERTGQKVCCGYFVEELLVKDVYGRCEVKSIEWLEHCPNLKKLVFENCHFDFHQNCNNFWAPLRYVTHLEEFSILATQEHVQEYHLIRGDFSIHEFPHDMVIHLNVLEQCTKLRKLVLQQCYMLHNVQCMPMIPSLEEVYVTARWMHVNPEGRDRLQGMCLNSLEFLTVILFVFI